MNKYLLCIFLVALLIYTTVSFIDVYTKIFVLYFMYTMTGNRYKVIPCGLSTLP